jgi:hypothetical protein
MLIEITAMNSIDDKLNYKYRLLGLEYNKKIKGQL